MEKRPAAWKRRACAGCARGVVACSPTAGRRQDVTGELAGATRRVLGKAVGVELTQAAARCGGGGECFRRQGSSVGRELRWPVATEARPCSVGVEEGR
jgi:hypothetical protein